MWDVTQSGGDATSIQSQNTQVDMRRDAPDRQSLTEMMAEAKQRAEQRRDSFRPRRETRYGDAPLEAYARLARARTQMEAGAAAGYARRCIAQFKVALRQDSDNAPRIKVAIAQLQKAVFRAGKKKKEILREHTAEQHQKKVQTEQRQREAARLKQEITRRRALRAIRERGYLSEAAIENRIQDQLEQTRAQLNLTAQQVAAPGITAPQAAEQYAAMINPAQQVPAEGTGFSAEA